MGFSYLDNLFWFLGIPLGFLLVFLIYRRGGWALSMFFNKEDYKNGNALSKTILRLAGLCFAFIAILGPYWGKTDQNVFLLGREIYIVLDISASMNADDLKPTRLDKCKREILNLIETLKGDQIGLIVFASQAYVQCPITRDYRALYVFGASRERPVCAEWDRYKKRTFNGIR
jgi:Ca-activated chloride channel family protein